MPYRQIGSRLQMLNTAHVRGSDCARICRGKVCELAIAQFSRQDGLQYGIGSGGSTAQVTLARRGLHIESKRSKLRFHAAAQSLAMLQRARCVEGDAPDRGPQLSFE